VKRSCLWVSLRAQRHRENPRGARVRYSQIPVAAARAWPSQRISERYVEPLRGQWEEETHEPSLVSSDAGRITGRPAASYAEGPGVDAQRELTRRSDDIGRG
jgi:hypothetical protein